MTILLIGGNAALQRSVASACTAAGHTVRVLTTHAPFAPWPARVEPLAPAASTPGALRRFAHGCDAVVAVNPSLTPSLPPSEIASIERTLEAAGGAGIGRLIVVTGLDDGTADSAGGAFFSATGAGECVVIRTAPPYGIIDDAITLLLIMMRSLPVVPVAATPATVRPIWHEDLARCIAVALSLPPRTESSVYTVGGPDAVSAAGVYERIAALIDRQPARVPVPEFIDSFGRRMAEALGIPIGRVLPHLGLGAAADDAGETSIPAALAGAVQTTLDEGLRRVIRELAEVTPAEGVGRLQVKTFSTVVRGSRYGAAQLMMLFRARFGEIMPVDVGIEPAAPAQTLAPGSVLTIALPGRGHVQIRVVDVQPEHTIVATLRGHTVAGIVRFRTAPVRGGVQFEVMTCDRAANAADWVGLTLGGSRLQDANWAALASRVAEVAGMRGARVRVASRRLSEREARQMEAWIAGLLPSHERTAEAEPVQRR